MHDSRVPTPSEPTDVLDRLLAHYPGAEWLAPLRALEVKRFHAVRDACRPPVLDLGCGDGYVSSLALGPSITAGIDLDEMTLKRAAARRIFRVLLKADARRLPFAAGSFRTVYSNGAMEHMDDIPTVLGEIARVLVPGGVLAALVPSGRFRRPVGRLGTFLGERLWNAFNQLHHHVNLLSVDEWRGMLRDQGFVITWDGTYGGAEVAERVATMDLWSKIHIGPRWPFFRLVHRGNLVRFMSGRDSTSIRRLFDEEMRSHSDGCWLILLAARR
jgi:SAM-dependent methyltransferase